MIRHLTKVLLVGALLVGACATASAQGKGNVICPTAAPGTSDNRCASTAFVQGAIPLVVPLPLSLANGGLGESQFAATVGQVPVLTGGVYVPTTLSPGAFSNIPALNSLCNPTGISGPVQACPPLTVTAPLGITSSNLFFTGMSYPGSVLTYTSTLAGANTLFSIQ